jgi:hypothetical protein
MKEEVQSVVFISAVRVQKAVGNSSEQTSVRAEEGTNGRLSLSVEGGIITMDTGTKETPVLTRVPLTNVRYWVPKAPGKEAKK